MDKIAKLLKSVNQNATIRTELATAPARRRDSDTLNKKIMRAYPALFPEPCNLSKSCLLTVWTHAVAKAGAPKEGGMSRTWASAYKELDAVIKMIYTNENTSESVFVQFRKPVMDRFGSKSEVYKQSTYVMGISQERSIEKKQIYADKVAVKSSQRESQKPIYDAEVYSAIQQGIASNDPLDNVVALQLATGARFIEVLKVSQFSETKEESDRYKKGNLEPNQFIRVEGIAKDRAQQGYEKKVIIRGLVGLTAQQVVEKVNYVRSKLDVEGELKQVTARYNSGANRRTKKLFPEHQDLTSHSLRYINAILSFLLYGSGAENTYVQAHLGHQKGDTSRTYQGINVQLRNAPTPSMGQNADAKFSELKSEITEIKETNQTEHEEMKQDMAEQRRGSQRVALKKGPNAYTAISKVDFPDLVNPKRRLGEEARFKLLDDIFKRYKEMNITPRQTDLKKYYKFGSPTLSAYYSHS